MTNLVTINYVSTETVVDASSEADTTTTVISTPRSLTGYVVNVENGITAFVPIHIGNEAFIPTAIITSIVDATLVIPPVTTSTTTDEPTA